MTAPAPSGPARSFWLLALATVIYAVAAFHCLRHGALNPDEGFYAAAARAVWEGHVPYRDFGYTQPPVLPYVNGLVMKAADYGLFEQRTINAVWTALALLILLRLAVRRASATAATGLLLLAALNLPWLYFVHLGKTYALTGLMVAVATWLWLEHPPGLRKTVLLGVVGVLGVGCRLPAGPFFGLLWLAGLAEPAAKPRLGTVAWAVAALSVAAAVLLLPFYLLAPEASVFWVLDFHRVSVPLKDWHLAWQEILTLAPGLWLATAIGLVAAVRRSHILDRREWILAVVTLTGLAANLLPGGVYEEYAVPFLPPLGLVAVLALHRFLADRRGRLSTALIGGVALTQLIATPLVLWSDFPARRLTLSQWLTPNAPAFNPALPRQIAEAREIVKSTAPTGHPVAGPNLILAIEAGRPVPPALLMGPFSMNTTLPAAEARKLHLATPEDYEALLDDPSLRVLAFFPQPQLNYGWTVPTFERAPEATARGWLDRYKRDFSIAYADGNFLVLVRPDRPANARRLP